jgi:hypothetical protein
MIVRPLVILRPSYQRSSSLLAKRKVPLSSPPEPTTVEVVESWQPQSHALPDYEERSKSVPFDPVVVTAYVRSLLGIVVHVMQLENPLVIRQMRFQDTVCSTTVFKLDLNGNMQPIGLVEIVPPGILGDEKKSVADEVYDRLTTFSFPGPKRPLALLTDSQHWQLAGLRPDLPSLATTKDDSDLDTCRRVYLSNVVKDTDWIMLGRFLEGAVKLMMWSGQDLNNNQLFQMPVQSQEDPMPVRILDLSEESSAEKPEILFDQHPSPQTNEFIWHSRLGKGANGVCYLATDHRGRACAMKSFDLSRGTRGFAIKGARGMRSMEFHLP